MQMNSIKDLEIQNLYDCRSLLYLSFAHAILSGLGIKGEEALRETVRRYGARMGSAEREGHEKNGVKVNLLNFYTKAQYHIDDPRFFCECQRLNEQVALFNVIRCPFAHAAALKGRLKEAKIFCEEYCAACLEAYTQDVAQINLSEVLTEPRDTHCRIAAYFRPGNIANENYGKYFESFIETYPMFDGGTNGSAHDALIYSTSVLLQTFMEDKSATADWMRDAGTEIGSFLKQRATNMEQRLDDVFLSRNCPLPISTLRANNSFADFLSAFNSELSR